MIVEDVGSTVDAIDVRAAGDNSGVLFNRSERSDRNGSVEILRQAIDCQPKACDAKVAYESVGTEFPLSQQVEMRLDPTPFPSNLHHRLQKNLPRARVVSYILRSCCSVSRP